MLVALAALLVARFGGDFVLWRRLGHLLAAARRIADGDLSARSGIPYEGDEIGELARAFDHMVTTLASRVDALAALQATVLDITTPHELTPLLHTIVERAAHLIDADGGGLYLCDPERRQVRCVVSYNTPRDYTGVTLAYGEGAAGRVAQTGEPLLMANYRTWAGRAAVYEEDKPFGAVLSVPIRWQGQVIGVLHALRSEDRPFRQEDLALLALFADHAAIAVENARHRQQIQQELAERRRVEAGLRQREAILEAVAFGAERFLQAADWRTVIPEVLARLGAAAAVSRVYLFANHLGEDGEILTSQRAEWCAPGIPPQIDNPLLQNVPLVDSGFERWVALLGQGREIAGLVREFPASERDFLAAQEIQAILVIPIFVRGTWWGFIGFDQCDRERVWEGAELDALKAAAHMLGAAIARQDIEQALRESEANYRLLVQTSPYAILVCQQEQVVFANAAAVALFGVATPADLSGLPLVELVAEADRTPFMAHLNRLQNADEAMMTIEVAFRRRDGHTVPVEAIVSSLTFEGQPAVKVIAHDITERRRHERELEAYAMLSRAIGETLELEPLLDHLLAAAQHAVPAGEKGSILLREADGRLRIRKLRGYSDPRLQDFAFASDSGFAARAVRERRPMRFDDVRGDPTIRYDGEIEEARALRSAVAVPLVSGDEIRGVMTLDSTRYPAFTDADLQTLSGFAATAALIIDNARLFAETQRRLHELETLFKLSRLLRTARTAEELLPLLLEYLQSTFAGDATLVGLIQPGQSVCQVVAATGELTANLGGLFAVAEGIAGEVLQTRQPYISLDFAVDPHCQTTLRHRERFGPAAFIPILSEMELIGILMIARYREEGARPFSPEEVRLLVAVGEMVGNALRRITLHVDALHRLQQVQSLHRIETVSSGTLDPKAVTAALLDEVMAQPGVDAAAVLFFNGETESLTLAEARGLPADLSWEEVPLRGDPVERVLREGHALTWPAAEAAGSRWQQLRALGLVACSAAPLMARDRVLGVVEAYHRHGFGFAGEWRDFLETLAGQAALALDNVRLYRHLQDYAADLERRVAERTAALQAANEELRRAHTEISRALARERELGELKSRFVSMVSHEIRTPLAAILSSAELLERYGTRWPEEKRLTHLRRIQQTVQRLTTLLEDVLWVSRAETGRLSLHPKPLDLVAFCRDLLEEMRLTAADSHQLILDLSALPEPRHLEAVLDDQLLHQILHNLLSNAVKYSPHGGPVRLALRREDDRVVFSVTDRGIGIPASDQERLFEPFHRGGNVGAITGTGLGLNIVRRAVELQGGSIDVKSQEGEGTTVTVVLPLVSPASTSAPTTATAMTTYAKEL
jgi:PAS domain S-box-containing protein